MSDAPDTIGSLATGGLIAREIERAGAGLPAVGHDPHEPCANCGTRREGPYCHACGQAGHVHRNLFSLVHDLAHGVFHFEGKIWKTLPMLAWRPGELTRRYVHGERAKFVSPMALFLFSVFLLFAIIPNLDTGLPETPGAGLPAADGKRINLATKVETYRSLRDTMPTDKARAKMAAKLATAEAELAAFDRAQAAPKPAAAAPKAAAAAPKAAAEGPGPAEREQAQHAASTVDTGIPFVNYAIHHAAENPSLTAYKLKTYAYKYSWMLIPISVPFIWLLFAFRRDVGGYDHAIFAIYSLSFMSLGVVALGLLSWIGAPTAIVALSAIFVPPIHMYRQLKGAYRIGRFGALWRTGALLVITAITLALFFSFLVTMQSA